MLKLNGKEIVRILYNGKDITDICLNGEVLWSLFSAITCYSSGYWDDNLPWLDDYAWVD